MNGFKHYGLYLQPLGEALLKVQDTVIICPPVIRLVGVAVVVCVDVFVLTL